MQPNLNIFLQRIVPQHLLTRAMGWLANCRWSWLKNACIDKFMRKYSVDLSKAVIENPQAYPTFNDFFTRALKPEFLPTHNKLNKILSPAEGCVAQIGKIQKNRLIQTKNKYFTLERLLGGDQNWARIFADGSFATFYLAPHNYHRVHMPLTGRLRQTIYIPGKLFSVNQITSAVIPDLYARNERLIALFDTESDGTMAVIFVGAMIVASIQTVWKDYPHSRNVVSEMYPETGAGQVQLQQGEECGRFKLGSTVILLFGKDRVGWENSLQENSMVNVGQTIGNSLR